MNRRTFVALVSSGLGGIAGCVGSRPVGSRQTVTSNSTSTATPTNTPTAMQTETPTPTETAEPESFTLDGRRVERTRYDLRRLPYEKRPQFILERREPPRCAYNVDELDGIDNLQMATIDGVTGHMPIRTSRMIMRLLHCYRAIDRGPYLDKAEEIADAFLDSATMVDGLPYFAYTLPKGGSGEDFEPPWYSGMSQGTSLSAFLRLYEETGDEEYLAVADDIFETFTRLGPREDPWTVMVDDDGYYWIEEYPHDPPTHVLNGFNVGLWGLYEYWLLRDTAESRALLEAAITTIEHYIEAFRVSGEVSWYGLNRGYRGNEYYHAVHIRQLRELHNITGDPYFAEMEAAFDADSPESEGMK
ncbi:D-glucuronyl C5-epimerase family protein [Halogranum rubrum]|nr:D-glucuronyl C5-epimerase family protein [Halogranum salarium]